MFARAVFLSCHLWGFCLAAVLSVAEDEFTHDTTADDGAVVHHTPLDLDSERGLRGNKKDEDALIFTDEDLDRAADINIPAQRKRLRRFQRKWSNLGLVDYSFQYRENDGLYTVTVVNGTGQNANPVIMDDLFDWIRQSLKQGDNLQTDVVRFDQRRYYPSVFSSVYFDDELQATVNRWFQLSGVQSPPQTPQGYARTELTKARARWLSKNIKSYTFNITTVERNGNGNETATSEAEVEPRSPDANCARSQIRTVVNQKVRLPVLYGDDPTERVKDECGPFTTVLELFDAIGSELDANKEVDAEYSRWLGVPVSIRVYDSEERENTFFLRDNDTDKPPEPKRSSEVHSLVRLRKEERCPVDQPATDDVCNDDGQDCVYGEAECCGRMYVKTICNCPDGKYSCGQARGACPTVCPSL